MHRYKAVTKGSIKNCSELLRVNDRGQIEQYYIKSKSWQDAAGDMYGIYTGDIEYETISKKEAEKIIEAWLKNAI